MEEKKPAWTTDPPEMPGWYWFKESPNKMPEVIRVSSEGKLLFAGKTSEHDISYFTSVLWGAEPIMPPLRR